MTRQEKVKQIFVEVNGEDTDWSFAADVFVAWNVAKKFETESFSDFIHWLGNPDEEYAGEDIDFGFYFYGSDLEGFAEDYVAESEQPEYFAFAGRLIVSPIGYRQGR